MIIAHNIRSAHNVGSLLRTADGIGVKYVYLTGYTPYPKAKNDNRLPHLADKIDRRIRKASLGAENTVKWVYDVDISAVINTLKSNGFEILALEQTKNSIRLDKLDPKPKLAVVLGSEVTGIDFIILSMCDRAIYIPMLGKKESFNVVQAAAMALYRLRYF